MIDVPANVKLEVETAPPAGQFKNLNKNPNGALGGFFYTTPTGGSVDSSPVPQGTFTASVRYSPVTGASVGFTTERMPVTAGQYVTAKWRGTGVANLVVRFDFEDASGAVIGTSGNSAAFTPDTTVDRVFGPHLVPASTVNMRLVYTPSTNISGQVYEVAQQAVVARPTNAVTNWATEVVDGPTWANVIAPAIEVEWERQALGLGILSAVIRDATLDPMTAATIRPGRACRLSVKHGVTGTYEVMFEGELVDFDVDYDAYALARKAGDPKHCKITLSASDRTRVLASVRRPAGYSTLFAAREVLEDAGVPWSINGNTAHESGTPVTVSWNDNASALDQIAVARDSLGCYAWLSRRGVLNLWERSKMGVITNPDFRTDITGWTGGQGTRTWSSIGADTPGSLRVVATINGALTVSSPLVPIVPGHPYTVTFRAHAQTTTRATSVRLNWRGWGGANLGTTTGVATNTATAGFSTHTVTVNPSAIPFGAVAVFADIIFAAAVTGDAFLIDDVRGLGAEVTLDQTVWNQIDVGGGSKGVINEVTVDYLRYVPPTASEGPKSEVIPYGPYRNEASIAEYGVRPAKFTIHGTSETADVAALQTAVLAANASPKVTASRVSFGVKSTADLVMTRALGDLQQPALVSFADKGYAETLRITGVKHSIKADAKYKSRWIVEYTFASPATVAVPRSIPSPPSTAFKGITADLRGHRGVATLTYAAATQTQDVVVNFPPGAFLTAPVVTLTATDHRFLLGIVALSNTSMTIRSYYVLGNAVATFSMGVHWIAVAAP